MRSEFAFVCGESDRRRYPISGIASTGAIFQKLRRNGVSGEIPIVGQNEG